MDALPPDPALIAAWTRGWALARETPPPAADRGGWRVEVGWPDQLRRHVFADLGEGYLATAAATHEPFVLLKAPRPPEVVRAALPPHWRVEQMSVLMTCTAPAPQVAVPAGYVMRIEPHGPAILVTVTGPEGETAASGRAVCVDGMIVFDRIRTEEAHRRRGLGRVVMGALDAAHRSRGATHAALTATPMGRELYLALGWRERAPWTTAQIPASPAPHDPP